MIHCGLLRNTYCSRIHWKTLKMTLIGEVGWSVASEAAAAAVCWWTQVQKTFSWVGYQNVTPFLDIPRHFLAAELFCRKENSISKRTYSTFKFFSLYREHSATPSTPTYENFGAKHNIQWQNLICNQHGTGCPNKFWIHRVKAMFRNSENFTILLRYWPKLVGTLCKSLQ